MKHYDIDGGKPFTYWHDLLEGHLVTIGQQRFSFSNEAEAKLLHEAFACFGPGEYYLPDNEAEAQEALDDWLAHKAELDAWFRLRSEDRLDDERFYTKMMDEWWFMYRRYRQGLEDPPGSRKSPVHKVKVERDPNGEPVPIVFGPIPRGNYAPPELEEAQEVG